jgi:dynein heavy chain
MDYLDRVSKDVFSDRLNIDPEQCLSDYYFAEFQRDDVYDEYDELVEKAPLIYEACPNIDSIRDKAIKKLEQYNEKYSSKKMNLVIFDDALQHLLRITRIINAPSVNALLVGVGGSGK